MATIKISEMTAASTLTGAEIVPALQSSANVRTTASAIAAKCIEIQLACSNLTTDIEAATTVAYCRAPRAFTLTAVRSSLATASSEGAVTVDINIAGSTVLSTKLSIDVDEVTSTTAATPAVISNSTVADDALIQIDIDADGQGAKGLIVTLIGT